jgi:SWI/SNF-related matrix-associated actin-dependent regulator of chromatin subfamily A3
MSIVERPQLTDLTGVVSTQIVGVRFYRGYANPHERVIINREANNQYDRNAIRVDNVMGAQIGHIPRQMAAKLAAYIVRISKSVL